MCLFSCARACRTLIIACTHSLLLVRVHSQWCSLILRCTFILACAHSFSHAYTRSRSHALVLAVRVCFHWCLFSLTRVALTCTGSFVAVVHVAVNVVVNVVVEWMWFAFSHFHYFWYNENIITFPPLVICRILRKCEARVRRTSFALPLTKCDSTHRLPLLSRSSHAPAHHSLSNSSHGSSYYYLSNKKSFPSLIQYNTVRRFSLVRTFASNVIVVLAGPLPPNGSHWTPHRSNAHTRNLSFLD